MHALTRQRLPSPLNNIEMKAQAIEALARLATVQVSSTITDGHIEYHVDTTGYSVKLLTHCIPALYILCKPAVLSTAALDVHECIALATILKEFATAKNIVSATPAEIEMMRAANETLLMVCRMTTKSRSSEFTSLAPHTAQACAIYLSMLSEAGVGPALIVALSGLDLLLCTLPMPGALDAAVASNAPLALVNLWRFIDSPAYAAKYDAAKLDNAKGKILKSLTYLLGSGSRGADVYMQCEQPIISVFHRSIGKLMRESIADAATHPLQTTSAETPSTMVPHPSPTLGHRALRLISVLMTDKRCRLRLVADNILADLINTSFVAPLLLHPAPPITALLFTTLQRAAENSGVRFRMRDGRFWNEDSEDTDSDVSDQSTHRPSTQISPFTVVHFCIAFFILGAALPPASTPHDAEYRANLMQRAMTFLYGNYSHDTSVAETLCGCPMDVLGEMESVVPREWRVGGGRVVSAFPVLIGLITGGNGECGEEMQLEVSSDDGDAKETPQGSDNNREKDNPPTTTAQTRLAAASLLDALITAGKALPQLLSPTTLSTLTHSLNPAEAVSPVSKILTRVLGRLISSPELLNTMVENMGFSAVFETLLGKERMVDGSGRGFMNTFAGLLAKDRWESARMLCRLFEYHSNNANARHVSAEALCASRVVREKIALALAYCWGGELLSAAVLPPTISATHITATHHATAKTALDWLFSLALRFSFTDDVPEDADEGMDEEYAAGRHDRACAALRYLAFTSDLRPEDALPPDLVGADIPPCDTSLLAQIYHFASTQTEGCEISTDDGDTVLAHLTTDNTTIPFPRAAAAAASQVLSDMLYGGYRESRQDVVHIEDVEAGTWRMMVGYFTLAGKDNTGSNTPTGSDTPPPPLPYTHPTLLRVLRLLTTADKFLMAPLIELCMQHLHSAAINAISTEDGVLSLETSSIDRWRGEM
ncbi:uncharacterized protein EV422DRAFT_509193 [Fimicolochytrium jonesii]|uniref:uncharacterized protein n=1 Tax=Fimicolochytrium jonesii TaxID=1396493 RepID=UPI0022FE82EF|nr:uncharacterized protein EV422DRAFT_509193 [Fimicolochytrium jonesii]KAI8817159.1 hypothetical protein EV422DRAFT_509193 [Fimicolochytrium jonesii]